MSLKKICIHRWVLFYLGSVWLLGCSTMSVVERKLSADKLGSVSKLDDTFNVMARLGSLPTDLNPDDPVARYSIQASGVPSEVIVIFQPQSVRGTIMLPIADSAFDTESAMEYEEYLDLILRAHRALLKGETSMAGQTIQKIEQRFDVTYGSLVLSANIATIEGDFELAQKKLQLAKSIFLQAPPLDVFVFDASNIQKQKIMK